MDLDGKSAVLLKSGSKTRLSATMDERNGDISALDYKTQNTPTFGGDKVDAETESAGTGKWELE